MSSQGTLYGVGVGPGDPELLTLKAVRCIEEADVVAYLAGESGQSQAKDIARMALERRCSDRENIVIPMPMATQRDAANAAYDDGARFIAAALEQGLSVAFLCEGDPLFFGSFTYVMERLMQHFTVRVIPGISSVHAAAATLQHPLTVLNESFCVMSGRHSEAQLRDALKQHDSVVIMKAGRARPKILHALHETQRMADAQYLEYIGRENEYIERDVHQLAESAGPYFSLFVITRQVRGTR